MSEEALVRGMRAQLELRDRMLAEGARQVGWKVGLNPSAIHGNLGLSGPIVGFLTDATLLEPGATFTLPRGGDAAVVVEPEVGIEVGADGASVAALMPALEIVELDRALEEVEQLVAEDIFHRAVVLGPRSAPGPLGAGRVLRDGVVEAEIDAAGALDGILEVVARRLEPMGEALAPGQVVIAGALRPPARANPGARIALELDGFGRADVAFA